MKHNHAHQINLAGLLDLHGIEEAKQIRRAVSIGCVVNLILLAIKVFFGYYGHSEALVADGFHSIGDVGTDIVMLAFVGLSFRPASKTFAYGYGKFETFASLVISGILIAVAVFVTLEAVESIKEYLNGGVLERPDSWTVVAIVFAICTKELLFRFYRKVGKRTRCNALVSSAWHHRSDAFASVATLVGVSCAHFMGESWRILDPCASLVIVLFILIPACRLFIPAFRELMEGSIPKHDYEEAEEVIRSQKGISELEFLRTRKSGPFLIFDVIVKVSGSMTIDEGAVIASEIESGLVHKFGKNIRVSVITKPE
ncbi:MAG: cation diffusion facilitator family transporter [Muribaculaceae bacterium]|nr:cation diffusion facilitator family transporter [Muribaculaceae bacterium]